MVACGDRTTPLRAVESLSTVSLVLTCSSDKSGKRYTLPGCLADGAEPQTGRLGSQWAKTSQLPPVRHTDILFVDLNTVHEQLTDFDAILHALPHSRAGLSISTAESPFLLKKGI